jgi:hypothetical protein
MKRENLILPPVLKDAKSTGALLTEESLRKASEELEEGLREWFEEHRKRKLRMWERAKRIVLD